MRFLPRGPGAPRWVRLASYLIASTAVLSAEAVGAQTRGDSVAVLSAALAVTLTKTQPLFVLAYDGLFPRTSNRLNELLEEATRNVHLEWLPHAPSAIPDPDPKVREVLRDAVWLPHILRFRGNVTIDSLDFATPAAVRVEYSLTTYLEPRPSRQKEESGTMTLVRGMNGKWTVRADRVGLVNEDMSYYPFASPTIEPDSASRRWRTEVRAILAAHGFRLPPA